MYALGISCTEAQHTTTCASLTVVRVWRKVQVFIIELMNSSPTKKKEEEWEVYALGISCAEAQHITTCASQTTVRMCAKILVVMS